MIRLRNENLCCRFDEAWGKLLAVEAHGLTIPFDGLAFDFGCNGEMALGLLTYESMLEFRTWNLPKIQPTGREFTLQPERTAEGEAGGGAGRERICGLSGEAVQVSYRLPMGTVQVCYTLLEDSLRVDLVLCNTGEEALYLNTCGMLLFLEQAEGVSFDYPANAPIFHYEAEKLPELQPIEAGLVNFATHFRLPEGHLNVLFLDETEKWGCGTYRQGNRVCQVYHAGLEMDLGPGDTCFMGSLYIQPCAPAKGGEDGEEGSLAEIRNPYLKIRRLVERLGYAPCAGGIVDGVMYSGHPAGTMDKDFPLQDDLYAYAGQLPALRQMGVDHIWLLPVFDHTEEGVYHSNDQSVIHARYGGEAGCRHFCERAHELGMTVLFDYVPHGPAPEYPLVADHPDWPSKRRDGSLQDEWECVSMDYNHPGYQEYTTELVYDHVRRFGIDGARIDCAMGGLSNWRPYGDNRPSGNSVLAGVHITESIRNGFLRGEKPSFILPENFNPLPFYYHCTDLFYGMNLYRAFVELEHLLKEQPAAYVEGLTDFLEREAWITPEGYHKMRFLDNHDTVSWVWQSARAVDCYGTEAAKALFALISLIDGMPMIYQGDENPAIYGDAGENLVPFFAKLFHDRKSYLPAGNRTTYLHTGTPVMAFLREPGKEAAGPSAQYASRGAGPVLVLINLSGVSQRTEFLADASLKYGFCADGARLLSAGYGGEVSGPDTIQPYGYRIFRIC